MKEKLQGILQTAKEQLAAATDARALDEARVKFLGKKGELTALLKGMKDVAAEERPVVGQLINDVRAEIETIIDKQKKLLEQAAQLRLKNDHNGEYADAERVAQQPRDHGQMQEAGEQHDKHQNKNTLGQSCGAGILQQLHDTVNDIRHDEDIHHVDRRHCAELIKRTEKRTYYGPP